MADFYKILGGGTFGALLVAFFILLILHTFKKRISQEFQKELINYKGDIDEKVDKVGLDFKAVIDKKHFRYTHLEKKRFEAMEILYWKISEFNLTIQTIISLENENHYSDELKDQFMKTLMEYHSEIRRNELYFNSVELQKLEVMYNLFYDALSYVLMFGDEVEKLMKTDTKKLKFRRDMIINDYTIQASEKIIELKEMFTLNLKK